MSLQDMPNPTDMHVAQFRIERGAGVAATDAEIGTVQQIVVDHESGLLRSLIVRMDDSGREVELPANHIRRAVGNRIELDITRAELAAHPELARPYSPEAYVPLDAGEAMTPSAASQVAAQADKPVVTQIEENAAELISTDGGLAPEGEQDTVIMNQPLGATAPIAHHPAADAQAVRAAEDVPTLAPTAAPANAANAGPTAPEPAPPPPAAPAAVGDELLAREAPPTPVERQLPEAGETTAISAPGGRPAQPAPSTPTPGPRTLPRQQPVLGTEAQIPWGIIVPAAGLLAFGLAAFIMRRQRRRARHALERGSHGAQASARPLGDRWHALQSAARDRAARVRRGALPPAPTLAPVAGPLSDLRASLAEGKGRAGATLAGVPARATWFRRGVALGIKLGAGTAPSPSPTLPAGVPASEVISERAEPM